MSQRERFLAIAVAVVIGLFGVQYLFNNLSGTLREKQDAVDTALRESSDMDKTVTSGKIAARTIESLNHKSLPTDREILVAQYRDWLTELGKDVSMQDINVVVPERPIRENAADSAYSFSLRGYCRTDRVFELMGKFYDKDYLHTIKNLKLTLTKEPNLINVVLDSEAIALRSASPKQEPSPESSGRLAMSLNEYKDIILNRNPFSPPNQAPRINSERSYTIERGQRWSLDLQAEDPEGTGGVDWELVSEELPEWLRFRRGSFSGSPEENGEVEVTVRASDRGWPSASSEQKLVFKIVDPAEKPVEPPKFDVASQAFLSALISGRSGPEVWIRSRTEGQTLYLREGSDFELGSIKAKVIDINLKEDFVELETDGLHWTIGMDSSLADAYRKSLVD